MSNALAMGAVSAYSADAFINAVGVANTQNFSVGDRKRKKVERYTSEESDVAYLITMLNDLRHETKKRIDMFYNSDLTERKSH